MQWITEWTSLPNLHPAVVHFPIALLTLAVLLDLVVLLVRRPPWLEQAAVLLYGVGWLAAGIAYLAGRQAADSLGLVSPQAQMAISTHSDWALYTLVVFLAVAAVRVVVAVRAASKGREPTLALRGGLVLLGLAGLAMLLRTADLGGALVYKHGIAVAAAKTPGPVPASPANAGEHVTRLPDGGWQWQPLASDTTALPNTIHLVSLDSSAHISPVFQPVPRGLAFQVNGMTAILTDSALTNLQLEAYLDVSEFTGEFGLVYRWQPDGRTGVFVLGTDGNARLLQRQNDQERVLDRGGFQFGPGAVHVVVSVAGTHLKGFVNGKQVTHGHTHGTPSGRYGLWFNGQGVVRVQTVKVTPIS